MPFLRQARGLSLQPRAALLPINTVRFHPAVRYASHWNKHKKNHAARDFQEKPRSDHDMGSDKHQKAFWKSITPDFLTNESEASPGRRSHFAQVSSFKMHASHKSGSKPTVEASSTSWDSKTNEVKRTVYDPISGRMVPIGNGQSRQTSTSAKNRKSNQTPSKSYQKSDIVSQLPAHAEAPVNIPTTHASFTEDFEKIYTSEHEELLAARRHLDTLREQIQVLERQAHTELVKPSDTLDAERPPVFEGGWDNDPKGLQTAFKHEKEACEHGDREPLEQEMAALNKSPVQETNDDYSVAPSGMETLFAHEQEVNDTDQKSSLEQELVAMNTKPPPLEDGYSASPEGLENLFEQEQQKAGTGERESLEDEVRMNGLVKGQPQHTDVYSDSGLENSYRHEQKGTPQRLERELNLAAKPSVSEFNDAYSTEPIGMQTLYEREAADAQKGQRKDLEHELNDHIQARSLDESLLPNLDGMQNLWNREQEQVERGSVKSLEEEIRARQQPAVTKDKFDATPFGMETHFRDEARGIGSNGSQSLEDEMSRRVQAQTYNDDCSRSPSGLETAFDKEEKDAMLGKRQSLESEMNTPEPAFEDGYSTMPMGLQMMFRREKQSEGRTLEEDLKQMEEASYHEDGYSRAPIGMENSFDKETKTESDPLEEDFKTMPGEGDLSPTVGKFATSDKWYKQPSRSTFSEDSPKADNDELKQHTAVFGRSLDETTSNRIEPNVPMPKTANTAENQSPATIPESNSTNVHLTPAQKSHVAWAEPALYKVVAYDSGKDTISITTTPTNFSDAEAPISIPYAISRLDQAARFIPHLASLQNEGFQVIHAERDFLILRKVHKDSRSTSSRLGGAINPIDGTAKHAPIEPPTARFASPTGFVNYEPIFTPEPISKYKDTFGTSFDIPTHGNPVIEQHEYYPSPVDGRIVRKPRDHGFRKENRGRWRRRTAWLLSVAAGTAVSTYAFGVAGELSRPEKHVMRSSR
ncbi:hypothetical protein D6C77_09864 [Aureobasidium pullulans]|nr:hypothetical protein D6C77_09864 [Aureobasidium pullulans]